MPGPDPKREDLRELSLAVVGLAFPNNDRRKSNRLFEALLCRPGEPVELRPEPNNPANPHAIAVFSARGVQLGYLTAERAPWIGAKLRAGLDIHAVFQSIGDGVAIIRARFGGGSPSLPTAPKPRQHEPDDFEPDPDGPEWGA